MSEFAADFDDATYWFKSAENRALFVADPDRYAPQFGGLCAMTVAHGGIADPDPEAWTIADGKLYLFRAEGIAMFQQQMASIVSKATENWPSLRNSPETGQSPAFAGPAVSFSRCAGSRSREPNPSRKKAG